MVSKGCDFCRGYKTVVWLGGISRPCPQCNGTGMVQLADESFPAPISDDPVAPCRVIGLGRESSGDSSGCDDVDFIGDESSEDDAKDTPTNVLMGMGDTPKGKRGRPAKRKAE